jgi:hypothetical protein
MPWKRLNAGPCGAMSSSKARKPVSPAEGMRLLRTGRRIGLRCLRVTLHDTEVDCLVEKGFLKPSAGSITLRSRTPLTAPSAARSALSKIKRPDLHLAISSPRLEFACFPIS